MAPRITVQGTTQSLAAAVGRQAAVIKAAQDAAAQANAEKAASGPNPAQAARK